MADVNPVTPKKQYAADPVALTFDRLHVPTAIVRHKRMRRMVRIDYDTFDSEQHERLDREV